MRAIGTRCAFFFAPLYLTSIGIAADKLEWTRIFPSGCQTGTTVDVEATGKFPGWPVHIWSDTDAIRWTCQSEPGKLKATVDSAVPPGLHWVRLFSTNGSTSVRPFLVGAAIERTEVEPNDRVIDANAIEDYPQAIHGALGKKGDVDLYSVKLSAGQLLVATIDAAKLLQAPVDTNLQILDTKGFVLAENLDHVGLDPYVEFTAAYEGRFIVRVLGFPATPDSKIGFGGGTDWCYRLRLESEAGPFGNPIACPMPTELDAASIRVKPTECAIQDQALPLALPARVRSVISEPNQTHYFRFQARSDSHYRFRLFAREYGSQLDATVAVLDGSGKTLKQADDVANSRDPELLWKAPKDADYLVAISDFHRLGGDTYDYLAVVEESRPDFTLSIANDWIQSTVGKEIEIKVKVLRESDFNRSVFVEAEGLPSGVICVKEESKSDGDSSKAVTLKLKSADPFQGPIRIVGRTVENPEDIRNATSENSKPIWLSIGSQ